MSTNSKKSAMPAYAAVIKSKLYSNRLCFVFAFVCSTASKVRRWIVGGHVKQNATYIEGNNAPLFLRRQMKKIKNNKN